MAQVAQSGKKLTDLWHPDADGKVTIHCLDVDDDHIVEEDVHEFEESIDWDPLSETLEDLVHKALAKDGFTRVGHTYCSDSDSFCHAAQAVAEEVNKGRHTIVFVRVEYDDVTVWAK